MTTLRLGPIAHTGIVTRDLRAAMLVFGAVGVQWCEIATPTAVLQFPDGSVESSDVLYVTTRGNEPRIKIIQAVTFGYFRTTAMSHGVHHHSYWVDDLDKSTAAIADRFTVEATGLNSDGTPRYRYLVAGEERIELGLKRNRAEFDEWASTQLQP